MKNILRKTIRHKKTKLNENIYLNKLFEGLFDDEDLFSTFYDDSLDRDIAEIAKGIYKSPERLIDCRTIDEVNTYLINKYQIYNIIYDVLNNLDRGSRFIMDNIEFSDYCTYYKLSYSDKQYITLFKNHEINIKIKPVEITYRNKSKEVYQYVLTYDNKIFNYKYKIDDNVSDSLKKILIQLNNDIEEKLNSNEFNDLYHFITDVLEKIISNFIINELTCEGKVYKVVAKDIQRMIKCAYTSNYSGFDKITNAAKMAARLSAVYIILYNKYKETLTLNDDLILNIASSTPLWNTTSAIRYNRNRGLSDSDKLLLNIKKFSSLHIKDIIMTFNKYKDDPELIKLIY